MLLLVKSEGSDLFKMILLEACPKRSPSHLHSMGV